LLRLDKRDLKTFNNSDILNTKLWYSSFGILYDEWPCPDCNNRFRSSFPEKWVPSKMWSISSRTPKGRRDDFSK